MNILVFIQDNDNEISIFNDLNNDFDFNDFISKSITTGTNIQIKCSGI